MSQHDYVLDNQIGSSFRGDLNNALAAVVSNNSGATEPSTTYAYQFWADTATGALKQRNAANGGWVTVFPAMANRYGGILSSAMASTCRAASTGAARSAMAVVGKTDKAQTFSGGLRVTAYLIASTLTSFTVDPGNGPLQYGSNNGAFTLTAPANDGACDILVTNAGSAGTITFSGFTVSSSTGDALTTTNTSKFLIMIRRVNGVSTYYIKALQ